VRIADRRAPDDQRTTEVMNKTLDHGYVERQTRDRRVGRANDYNILVLKAGPNQFGMIVDDLFEPEEIVVKPLSSYLKDIKCFAGTTILGDGQVIMILDTGGVADLANLQFSDLKDEEARRREESESKSTQTGSMSVILFNNSPDEVFAVPQHRILRLEQIEREQIHVLGHQKYIKYRGSGLPIVQLEEHLPIKPIPDDLQEMFLLIPKYQDNGQSRICGGIVASRIIDALDVNVTLKKPFIHGPGLKGTAIIQDKLTIFLDPVELLDASGVVVEEAL
jgi:two-component system chemotaxis sensor kinase CheA